MRISVVIPVYNERENIAILWGELTDALERISCDFELLFVDDGSTDGGSTVMDELAARDSRVRVIRFRRNFGQTAAMQAGLEHATGDVIVTIDADLQNDPRDIPMMVEKLHEGFDLVLGWRRERQDTWLSRRLPSMIANALIAHTTGVKVHDLGCTLKVIRREIADELELYGQMHRFIPILASQRGARLAEVVTHHRPRQFGTSKYGISRTLQVLLDILTVKYMQDYFSNPMRLFGKLAIGSVTLGMLSLTMTFLMKLIQGVDMTGNPLLLLAVLAILIGVQFVCIGLLGEVSARIYFRRQGNRPFAIATTLGLDSSRIQTINSDHHRAA